MRRYVDDKYKKLEYVSTAPLWETVSNYKLLVEFYRENQYDNMASAQQIRDRIKYILDNKLKQKDEVATLYWVLGEEDERELRER